MMHTAKQEKGHVVMSLTLIPLLALCVPSLLYLFLPVTETLSHLVTPQGHAVSLLTTFFSLFFAIGFLVWGPLSDCYGRNRIILLGLTILTLITLMISLSTNYYYLLVLRSAQGFFASAFPPVALAWIAENIDERIRHRAVSMISCAFLLAGTIGQWFGALTVHDSLIRTMLPLAVIYISGVLIFYGVTRKKQPVQKKVTGTTVILRTLLNKIPVIFSDIRLVRIYCCASVVLMSFVSLYVMLNAAKENLHVDVGVLREITTLGMLTCLFSGIIFKKIRPNKVLGIALLVMAGTLVLQYMMVTWRIAQISVFLVLHVFFAMALSLAIPAMITCVAMSSAQENRGIAMSLYSCILFAGASVGSAVPAGALGNLFIPLLTGVLFVCGSSMLLTMRAKSS